MSEQENGQWQAIMPAEELWIGEMLGVEVAGINVLLVNVDDQVHAFLDRCPHRASRLSEGELEGAKITCPTHLWEFDALSGRGINPESSRLVEFPCRIVDGMIQVCLPDPSRLPEPEAAEEGEI
ncbi:MAG TPA: Rieske 2Fe-2S domain-containing protein [Candidatus Dormibacteraeota bacterium]|nr:Rieske 2Fe-2S domain-containing protein [Candidatus Dormibacteraeota bacterium]